MDAHDHMSVDDYFTAVRQMTAQYIEDNVKDDDVNKSELQTCIAACSNACVTQLDNLIAMENPQVISSLAPAPAPSPNSTTQAYCVRVPLVLPANTVLDLNCIASNINCSYNPMRSDTLKIHFDGLDVVVSSRGFMQVSRAPTHLAAYEAFDFAKAVFELLPKQGLSTEPPANFQLLYNEPQSFSIMSFKFFPINVIGFSRAHSNVNIMGGFQIAMHMKRDGHSIAMRMQDIYSWTNFQIYSNGTVSAKSRDDSGLHAAMKVLYTHLEIYKAYAGAASSTT